MGISSKIRVIDFFSGIGAFDAALDRLGIDYELVDAVDIDKYAVQSFNAVHGTNFEPQDITEWDKDVGHIDIMWQSSPCTDLSVAGKQEGANKGSGTRSSLVWEVIRIAAKMKPEIIIWENVKGLTTKRHKHILDEYIYELEKLGYTSHWKVLNSKNFCVPQNRERCYTISTLSNEDYEFPHDTPLSKRLKDVLEHDVDEKYYLSEERLAKIKLWDKRQRDNGRGFKFETRTENDVARTVTTSSDRPAETTYVEEKPVRLGGMYDNEKGRHQAGSIYANDGISPTLDTCSGGNRMPYVEEDTERIIEHNKNPKHQQDLVQDQEGICRTIPAGTHGSTPHLLKTVVREPQIEFVGGYGETDRIGDGKNLSRNYPQGNRVYSTDGIAVSQTADGGGLGGKTGLYVEKVGNIYPSGGQNGNVYSAEGLSPTISSGETPTKGNGGIGSSNAPKIVDSDPVIFAPNNYKHKAGDGMSTRIRVAQDYSGTIAANPGGNGEMWVGEPQPIKRRRTELGKELRKAYENHEIPANENMRENYVADDGVMPALTCSRREQQIAEPSVVAVRGRSDGDWTNSEHYQKAEPRTDGITNTITSVQKDNLIAESQGFVENAYNDFQNENGYVPENFNPYNRADCGDVAPTQTTQCGSTTSSATVLVKESKPDNLKTRLCKLTSEDSVGYNVLYEKRREDSREILQILQQKIGEEAFVEWTVGGLWCILSESVLWERVYAKSIFENWLKRPELVKFAHFGEDSEPTIPTQEQVRNLWVNWQDRYSSYRRELSEQQFRQLKSVVQELPHQVASFQRFVQGLWETYEGTGILRQALSEIQKIWKSDACWEVQRSGYRIRRLTPRSCWRLQGFTDEEFEKAEKVVSPTQLYKQAGNSVTVNVIVALLAQLGFGEKKWNKMSFTEREQLVSSQK